MKKHKTNKSKKPSSPTKRRKKKQTIWYWIGFGGLLLIGGITYFEDPLPESLSAASTPQNVQQGEQLFTQNCAACHGPGARGEDPSQPKGGTKADGSYLAPALNGTGHAWHHSNPMLFDTIKNGSPAKNSPMVGFNTRLNDEEIVAVMQYLKSLWPEEIQTRHAQMLP